MIFFLHLTVFFSKFWLFSALESANFIWYSRLLQQFEPLLSFVKLNNFLSNFYLWSLTKFQIAIFKSCDHISNLPFSTFLSYVTVIKIYLAYWAFLGHVTLVYIATVRLGFFRSHDNFSNRYCHFRHFQVTWL